LRFCDLINALLITHVRHAILDKLPRRTLHTKSKGKWRGFQTNRQTSPARPHSAAELSVHRIIFSNSFRSLSAVKHKLAIFTTEKERKKIQHGKIRKPKSFDVESGSGLGWLVWRRRSTDIHQALNIVEGALLSRHQTSTVYKRLKLRLAVCRPFSISF